jgi:hypothetical protein
MQFIPKKNFDELCVKWEMNKSVRNLRADKLIFILISAVVYDWKNLRDIETATGVKKSTLADALTKRPCGFLEQLFEVILKTIKIQTKNRNVLSSINNLIAIDSTGSKTNSSLMKFNSFNNGNGKAVTKFHAVYDVYSEIISDFRISGFRGNDLTVGKTISLKEGSHYVFDRGYVDLDFWMKIEKAKAFFVTRLKNGKGRIAAIHKAHLSPDITLTGVLYDKDWTPSETQCYLHKIKKESKKYRHIIYRDPITKKLFDFITNDIKSEAQTIADCYKLRWSVETLFKWLKTHVNLRKSNYKNTNAIRIHILSGIITHLLLRLKILSENIKLSTAELLRKYRLEFVRVIYSILGRGLYTSFEDGESGSYLSIKQSMNIKMHQSTGH